MLEALVRYGSPAIPMHMAIFNIPLKIAEKFEIPLIIWGENSAFEYSGSEPEKTGFMLTKSWLKKFGVTNNTTAQDWVGPNLSKKELTPYFGPNPDDLEKQSINAIFLGYYYPWDAQLSNKIAKENGFMSSSNGSKTGIYDFADIDDDFISIHHYLKWYKFGFTRAFDNLSLEIRHGRIERKEALQKIKILKDQKPTIDISRFCDFVKIDKNKDLI